MKNVKNIIRIAFPLLLISTVTVAVLAIVNALTAPQIELHTRESLNNSMISFFGEGCIAEELSLENRDLTAGSAVGSVKKIYKVTIDHTDVGYCFDVIGKGAYKNTIEMLIAVNLDGTVRGISTIVNNETPAKASYVLSDDYYRENYIGHTLSNIEPDKDVAFISGSTRTSTALNNAIRTALLAFDTLKGGETNEY